MPHPWSGTSNLVAIEAIGVLVGLMLIALAVWLCSPVDLHSGGTLDEDGTKLVEWEKDQVSGVAKGVAATSIG